MTELELIISKLTAVNENSDENKIFLGLWCLPDVHDIGEKEIISHPWSDNKNRRNDFEKIQEVYTTLLPIISKHLNHVHEKDENEEFWELIIGAWLQLFLAIFFERTSLANYALSHYKPKKVNVLDYNYCFEPASNYEDFHNLYLSENWNAYLYSILIKSFNNETKLNIVGKPIEEDVDSIGAKVKFVNFVSSVVGSITSKFNSWVGESVFFHNSYFSRTNEAKLSLRLKQIPLFAPIKLMHTSSVVDKKFRVIRQPSELDDEIEFQLSMILKFMPKSYLELFSQVESRARRYFPSKVKVIFTGVSDICDDHFKVWAAHQKSLGIPLVISQHGGCYGISELTQVEVFQRKQALKFYTWGWDERNPKSYNLFPMPAAKLAGRTNWVGGSSKILVTLFDAPLHSYWNQSFPVGEQMLEYLSDIEAFILAFPPDVQDDLLIRPYPHDFGWNIKPYLSRLLSNSTFDSSSSLVELMNNAKLCVSTCNSTTFLESMASGAPTIAFWRPEHFSIREDAKPLFNELKEVRIFHETPSQAAKFVCEIKNNTTEWWESEAVKKVRDKFCQRYASQSDTWLEEWVNEIEKL